MIILWISLQAVLLCLVPAVWAETEGIEPSAVSAYKDVDAMWELVSQYSPSDEITAAVVTQIYFESFCESNAVGGGYLHGDEYSERVTAFIDEGLADGSSRDDFISHRAGELQAVFHRRDNCQWLVTMELSDWLTIFKEWEAGQHDE